MATELQLKQARRIVENEDYLPWAYVKAAKKLLGIVEPDHFAEVSAELAGGVHRHEQ
ncbi:hypothetical protein SAMN05880566_12310 [Janthinobacterium sp. TND4EL3]|uniref:hypothetical protein n=1 Tax=Pseudomonadota TaxID=1224 RepID=UPI0009566F4A|nr:hypothetical protein [Janthinobacterium sp. TND4EL3]SIR80361.1 hypothetical protein SAMN05880566_12310 [Janthinobacterium sp. TND4EL3]